MYLQDYMRMDSSVKLTRSWTKYVMSIESTWRSVPSETLMVNALCCNTAGYSTFTPACCHGGEVLHRFFTPSCTETLRQESPSCRSVLTGNWRHCSLLTLVCVVAVSTFTTTFSPTSGLTWVRFLVRWFTRFLETALLINWEPIWPPRELTWWASCFFWRMFDWISP